MILTRIKLAFFPRQLVARLPIEREEFEKPQVSRFRRFIVTTQFCWAECHFINSVGSLSI